MSRLAPEPTDRAIARILAGGLPDSPVDIAKALADLLNQASDAGIAVLPDLGTGEHHHEALYHVEQLDGPGRAQVDYDTVTASWHATVDPAT